MNKLSLLLFLLLFCISCNNKKLLKIDFDYMYPTIQSGDYVLVDKSINSLDYGDIIYYYFKGDDDWSAYYGLFRIVSLPDDSISINDYVCTINGIRNKHKFIGYKNSQKEYEEILPNNFIIHTSYFDVYKIDGQEYGQEPMKVPNNHYYLLGDSRDGAIDSRHFGPVPKEEILGKVVKIIEGDREEY